MLAAAILSGALGWVLTSPRPESATYEGKLYFHDQLHITWQNASSFDLSEAVLRWGLPADPFNIDFESGNGDALSGGITWALHKDFCE